jgi:hypothetical protein
MGIKTKRTTYLDVRVGSFLRIQLSHPKAPIPISIGSTARLVASLRCSEREELALVMRDRREAERLGRLH